jgi:hypothetical protein
MSKPVVICLMPVKNEVDLLPITLPIISQYSDVIIIADQMSDDGSREVYKKFPKVKVIDNLREGHSNQVRWDLLKAAREYDGAKIILCLDADEYIPPAIFFKFIKSTNFKPGDSFRFPWIQLWKKHNYFNDSGVWYKNYQRAMWVDDDKTNYETEVIINDHTSRIPAGFLNDCKRIDSVPIIHLQWVSWDKTQLKQALYRCSELVKSPKSFFVINDSYEHSLDSNRIKKNIVPPEWTDGINSLETVETLKPTWHFNEIIKLFDNNGIEFFEPLQIWHIKELENEFIKRVGRKPVSVQGNRINKIIKNFKNSLVKLIHY